MFLSYEPTASYKQFGILQEYDAIWHAMKFPEEIIFEINDDENPHYVLLGYYEYYPNGGWNDKLVALKSLDITNNLFDILKDHSVLDNLQILDILTLTILREY